MEQNPKNALNYDPIVYSLETPKYHLLKFEDINRFSGWVFYFGNEKKIDSLNVYSDNQFLGHFKVELPREDIAIYAPNIPAAKTCGFAFDIKVEITSNQLTFEIVFDDTSKTLFLTFEVASVFAQQNDLNQLRQILDGIQKPTPDLIYLTLGHNNVEEYQNSIIPGVLNMRHYLEQSGVNLTQIHSVLDLGCGSGRLLTGWYLTAPRIELHGCDINEHLIAWAQRHLPDSLQFFQNQLMPPLPYQDNQFDLIYHISVFTHLSLETQKIWISELKRILKFGGYILLTLHGEIYVRHHFWGLPQKINQFLNQGFIEKGTLVEEGANIYGAFHQPSFVEQLFEDFQLVGYFPNGRINHQRTLFQLALSQDVYIFKYGTPNNK